MRCLHDHCRCHVHWDEGFCSDHCRARAAEGEVQAHACECGHAVCDVKEEEP